HLALAYRPVGEHWLAGGVADGEEARVRGRTTGVDLDETARILLHAHLVQSETIDQRPTADHEQNAIENHHNAHNGNLDTTHHLAEHLDLHIEPHHHELLIDPAPQPLHKVAVRAGQQP